VMPFCFVTGIKVEEAFHQIVMYGYGYAACCVLQLKCLLARSLRLRYF